jgi:hypothetical protein
MVQDAGGEGWSGARDLHEGSVNAVEAGAGHGAHGEAVSVLRRTHGRMMPAFSCDRQLQGGWAIC